VSVEGEEKLKRDKNGDRKTKDLGKGSHGEERN